MILFALWGFFFFFNDTAPTEIYTLSLHDALPTSVMPLQMSLGSQEKMAGRLPVGRKTGKSACSQRKPRNKNCANCWRQPFKRRTVVLRWSVRFNFVSHSARNKSAPAIPQWTMLREIE